MHLLNSSPSGTLQQSLHLSNSVVVETRTGQQNVIINHQYSLYRKDIKT